MSKKQEDEPVRPGTRVIEVGQNAQISEEPEHFVLTYFPGEEDLEDGETIIFHKSALPEMQALLAAAAKYAAKVKGGRGVPLSAESAAMLKRGIEDVRAGRVYPLAAIIEADVKRGGRSPFERLTPEQIIAFKEVANAVQVDQHGRVLYVCASCGGEHTCVPLAGKP